MMRVMKCDRCGDEIKGAWWHAALGIRAGDTQVTKDFELCPECFDDAKELLTRPPKRLMDVQP